MSLLHQDSKTQSKYLGFNSQNDKLILYLCRVNEEGKTQCANLAAEDFSSNKFFIFTDPNHYLDVEIQHFKFENAQKAPKIFSEVYLTLKPNVSRNFKSYFYLMTNSKSEYDLENGYFLCETSDEKITIGTTKAGDKIFHTFKLASGPLKFPQDMTSVNSMNQITPFLLEKQARACKGPNKKLFFFKRYQSSIVVFQNSKKELVGFNFEDKIGETDYRIMDVCEFPVKNLGVSVLDKKKLFFGRKQGFYPSEVIVRSGPSSKTNLGKVCVEVFENSDFAYSLDLDAETKSKMFQMNFNLQPDDSEVSKNSLAFLSDANAKKQPDFFWSKFYYPEKQKFVVLVSIVHEASKNNFNVRGIYLTEGKKKHEFFFSNKMSTISAPPQKIFYSSFMGEGKEDSLTELENNIKTVYLSETEVVYQLFLSNFAKLEKTLEFDDEKNILTIKGAKKGILGSSGSSEKEVQKDDRLTAGLLKVIKQLRSDQQSNLLIVV